MGMRGLQPRPSIPPLLIASLGLAAGAAGAPLVPAAQVATAVAVCTGPVLAFAGARCTQARSRSVTRLAWPLILSACVVTGIALGLAADSSADVSWACAHRLYRGYGEIASEPLSQGGTWKAEVVLLPPGRPPVRATLAAGDARKPYVGERVAVTAVLSEAGRGPGGSFPAVDAQARSVARAPDQGALGPLWEARARFCSVVASATRDPGVALIAAWTATASDAEVKERSESMRSAGVPWLGGAGAAQLALVVFALGLVGRALPWVSRVRLAPSALGIAGAWGFWLLAGGRPTLLRAAIAATMLLAAAVVGRRAHPLAALAVAISATVTVDPGAALEVGLWLPVTAVAAVQLVGPLVRGWLSDALPRAPGAVVPALAAGICATAGASPLAAAAFGSVSAAGPFVALAVVAPATVAMVGVTLLAPVVAFAPALARPALAAAAAPASLCAWVADAVAGSPLAAAPADALLLAVTVPATLTALWIVWPSPRARWTSRGVLGVCGLALVAPLLVPGSAPVGPRLEVMDVGQGDALMLADGPDRLLVDAGPDKASLTRALSRLPGPQPAVVLITHAHADHEGGLPALRASKVLRAQAPDAPREGGSRVADTRTDTPGERRVIKAGDRMRVGRIAVTVLWPPPVLPPEDVENDNDHSIVLLAECGGHRALLLGDAEREVQDRLASEGAVGPVDVVKVAHHGSTNGWSQALEPLEQPREALVSVGAGNRFGHPAPSVLAQWARAGVIARRTDLEGDLVFDFATGAVTSARGSRWARAPGSPARPATARAPCAAPEVAYATISSANPPPATRELHGSRRPFIAQARLPHMGWREPPARTGRDPPQEPLRRCR